MESDLSLSIEIAMSCLLLILWLMPHMKTMTVIIVEY